MSEAPKHEDSGDPHQHVPRSHHDPHQVRSRLHELIHPNNGRKIQIAQSPEELARRNKHKDDSQDDSFDILLHGSPEHIEAIEALHAHHTSIQQDLQEKHVDTFRLFEAVRDQIDILDAELQKLTDQSVALDANFDRFGYSAHLRTISETSSVNESVTTQHHCRLAQPLRLFRTPRIRQYFHKGLIWRSSQASEVAAFELFIDLVYVGVIDIMGKMAVDNPTGLSLLHFVIAFSIAAKIWCDMTMVINWFDVDDVFQRIMFAFYLVCLFGYTVNVSYMFSDDENTFKTAVGFYLSQRLALGLWYAFVAVLVPMIRGTMFTNIFTILTTSALWITTMHIRWAAQIPLMFLAVLIDLFGNIILVTIARRSNFSRGRMRYIAKWFDFYPAINIEHRVERNDSFVTLVFGYSVLTILYQSASSIGINAFLGKGILGLLQAFALHWIYFEVDAYEIDVHALRRHWLWATTWVAIHIPFVMSYVLAASTLSKIVLAHDSTDTNPDWLADEYTEESVSHLSSGLRWFYCGGLGVSLILMSLISLSHMHKKLPDARIGKNVRLGFRCCVAIMILCLAPAKKLDSLGLISVTFGLNVIVLCVDLFGNTLQGHAFWKSDAGEKPKTSYTADVVMDRHKRAELRAMLRKGSGVAIGDLSAKTHVNRPRGHRSEGSDKRHDEEWHGGHY